MENKVDKITELKNTIENSNVDYLDLTIVDENEIEIFQLYASEEITYNIKVVNNCYNITSNYYSQETGNNITSEETFYEIKDVLNFID